MNQKILNTIEILSMRVIFYPIRQKNSKNIFSILLKNPAVPDRFCEMHTF